MYSLLCLFGLALFGQEEQEDPFAGLFDEVVSDTPVEEAEDPLEVPLYTELITQDPIRVEGRVSFEGGAGVGLTQWTGGELDAQGGFLMSAGASVDARPFDYLRFFGSLSTELDQSSLRFTNPAIDELFLDYTLQEWAFFRVGKQSLTWGIGLHPGLPKPGNLVGRVQDGASVRLFVPAGTNGITGLVYSTEDFLGPGPLYSDLAYAGSFETNVGPISTGFFAHYLWDDLLSGMVTAKIPLGPLDLGLQFRSDWESSQVALAHFAEPRFRVLSQVVYYQPQVPVNVLAEYIFDTQTSDNPGHMVGLGLTFPTLRILGLRPGLSWTHEFGDHSGQVILGFEGPLVPSISGTLALPAIYGDQGTYFRNQSTDLGNMVVGLGLKLTLNMTF